MKIRTRARLVSFTMAALIVALGGVVYYYNEATNYKRLVENNVQQSINDLSTAVYSISTTLEKGIYANTPPMVSGLAAKLWKESSVAKNCLNALPLSDTRVEGTEKFLSQVGDYAMYLAKLSGQGEEIKQEDRDRLLAMSQYSNTLASQFTSLQSDILNQNGSVYDLLTQTGVGAQDSPNIVDGFKDTEEGFSEYPALIYDGPFSDHIMQMTPRLTEKLAEVTREQARAVAAQVSGIAASLLTDSGDEESNMPSYNFKKDDTSISVTKKGGIFSYLLTSREVTEYKLDVETAIAKAQSFVKALGINNLITTYYETRGGVVTVNFAGEQNGITCYPDLIKVGIALDDGSVVMYDARGYITNYHARTFASNIISASVAQSHLSPLLTPSKSRLVVIPTSGLNEVYCYEFLCTGINGEKVLVYINSSTGYEEQILILLEQEDSVLTI